jgi:16S rRNA (uracil1498-N3)-methyltransferase
VVLSERTRSLSSLPRLAIDPAQRDPTGGIYLTSPQRHYLQRVHRLRGGDPFLVLDGSGKLWAGHWQPQKCQIVAEVEAPPRELPVYLHLGLAVVKGRDLTRCFARLPSWG